jgi:hypothetical protein
VADRDGLELKVRAEPKEVELSAMRIEISEIAQAKRRNSRAGNQNPAPLDLLITA